MTINLYQGQKRRTSQEKKRAISELLCSLDCSGLFEKLVGRRIGYADARGATDFIDGLSFHFYLPRKLHKNVDPYGSYRKHSISLFFLLFTYDQFYISLDTHFGIFSICYKSV